MCSINETAKLKVLDCVQENIKRMASYTFFY